MSQITIFAQVIQLLPRDSFKKLVRKHQSDKHSKGISSWDHLVSMLFCQLAGAQSLRDISTGLQSTLGKRSHMSSDTCRARAAFPTSMPTGTGTFFRTCTSRCLIICKVRACRGGKSSKTSVGRSCSWMLRWSRCV